VRLLVCQHVNTKSCIVGWCGEVGSIVADGCVNVAFPAHCGTGGIACEAGGYCGIDVAAEWTW